MARKPADQTVDAAEVLHAAATVFHRKGYQGATMADIAAELNLTAGSLYHYFPSKEDLLLAVLDAGLRQISDEVRAVVAGDAPPPDKLRTIVKIHILSEIEHVHIATAVIFESRALLDVPGVREPYIRQRDALERLYRDVVEAGIASGDFRPVDVGLFVKTLFGALNWVNVWYREGGRLSGAAVAEEIAETFLHALTPVDGQHGKASAK